MRRKHREVKKRFLTVGDVCKLFGVNYSTVDRWIREGKLYVIRTATGRRLIPQTELRNLFDVW